MPTGNHDNTDPARKALDSDAAGLANETGEQMDASVVGLLDSALRQLYYECVWFTMCTDRVISFNHKTIYATTGSSATSCLFILTPFNIKNACIGRERKKDTDGPRIAGMQQEIFNGMSKRLRLQYNQTLTCIIIIALVQ